MNHSLLQLILTTSCVYTASTVPLQTPLFKWDWHRTLRLATVKYLSYFIFIFARAVMVTMVFWPKSSQEDRYIIILEYFTKFNQLDAIRTSWSIEFWRQSSKHNQGKTDIWNLLSVIWCSYILWKGILRSRFCLFCFKERSWKLVCENNPSLCFLSITCESFLEADLVFSLLSFLWLTAPSFQHICNRIISQMSIM